MNTYKAKQNADGNYEIFIVKQALSDDLTTMISYAQSEGVTTLAALETDLDRLTKEVTTIQAKIDAINAIVEPAPTA